MRKYKTKFQFGVARAPPNPSIILGAECSKYYCPYNQACHDIQSGTYINLIFYLEIRPMKNIAVLLSPTTKGRNNFDDAKEIQRLCALNIQFIAAFIWHETNVLFLLI